MPLNIATLDNAQLAGRSKFQRFYRTFQEDWLRPMREAQINQAIQQLAPADRDQLRRLAPEAMRDLEKRILTD